MLPLETLNGSIIDALYEESRIDIALEENPLDPELQSQLAGENLSGDRVTHATSPSLIGAIYPHRELPDSFKGVTVAETANIKGVNVTFIVGGTDRNIGYTSGRVSIVNPADFDALTETEKQILSQSTNTDIVGVSYTMLSIWGRMVWSHWIRKHNIVMLACGDRYPLHR